MEKAYISPEIKLHKLKTSAMIVTSPENGGDDVGDGDGDAKPATFSLDDNDFDKD